MFTTNVSNSINIEKADYVFMKKSEGISSKCYVSGSKREKH